MGQIFINGRFLTQKATGSQRNSYELVKALLQISEDPITILVPNDVIVKSYNITTFPIKRCGRGKGIFWEQIELPLFLIRHNSPLLVNLTNTAPLVYRNQIVSIMDMTTFVNPDWFSKNFARYYQWLLPRIARRANKVITISNNSKCDIIKYTGIPNDKVRVIYCAVSSEFIESKHIDSTILLQKLGIRDHNFFLAVSSLDPRKNFVSLIKAHQLSKVTNIPLVIVGSKGRAFNNPELSVFSGLENIVFTGYITDLELSALYRKAFCFIYPSLYEGFGIPPLEAMVSGCPTIVSNTSSLPEICGDASLYVDPYHISSIGTALELICSDEQLRISLINKGRKQAQKYNWKQSAMQLSNEINRNHE